MVVACVQMMAVETKRSKCCRNLFWRKKRREWEWGVEREENKEKS